MNPTNPTPTTPELLEEIKKRCEKARSSTGIECLLAITRSQEDIPALLEMVERRDERIKELEKFGVERSAEKFKLAMENNSLRERVRGLEGALQRFLDEFSPNHCECDSGGPLMEGKDVCDYCFGRKSLSEGEG